MKGVNATEHYWLNDSTLPDHVIRVFRRVSADVTIKAATYSALGPCNDLTKCYLINTTTGYTTDRPIVMWKNPSLKLYVTKSLKISNVIFDGADISPLNGTMKKSQNAIYHTNATIKKQRYCLDQSTADTISLVPNPLYPEGTIEYMSKFKFL